MSKLELTAPFCILVLILAVVLASYASADPTNFFELDGDAITDNPIPVLPEDWDLLYWGPDPPVYANVWTGILDDFGAEDIASFAGSCKDIDEIEDWTWHSNPVAAQYDIENAYAALYDNVFVFGADRYRTSGVANFAFWLLQDDVDLNPNGTFSGRHVHGDALILGYFSLGGRVSDIKVFRWDTTRTFGDRLVEITPLDSTMVYAYVSDDTSSSPWPHEPDIGPLNIFQPLSFFEGGADLSALGITGYFTDFLAETRNSRSLSAELKDFVLGNLGVTTDVREKLGSVSFWPRLRLSQNYPNPSNPLCTIRYEISQAGSVSLRVYDVLGSLVRTIVDAYREPGSYSELWDGRAEDGRELPSGVYFYRLEAGEFVATRKMVLLR